MIDFAVLGHKVYFRKRDEKRFQIVELGGMF